MSDSLALPWIGVGIPVGDANLSTPASTGVPVPGWTIGSNLTDRIGALHSWYLEDEGANPLGSGRSLRVDINAAYGGSASDKLTWPPSPFGMVPSVGVVGSFRPSLLVTYRANLRNAATAEFELNSYTAAGGVPEASITCGIMDNTYNDLDAWVSQILTPGSNIATSESTRYFRPSVKFSSGTTSGFLDIDFLGLAFLPDGGSGMMVLPEAYVIDGLSSTWSHKYQDLSPQFGALNYRRNLARGIRPTRVAIGFDRISETTRRYLEWFRHVNAGTPTGGSDKVISGAFAGHLGGFAWPLLVKPNHPGMKQAFYANIVDMDLDIDRKAGFVESSPEYSGRMILEEVCY